jgi:hypothetical protein
MRESQLPSPDASCVVVVHVAVVSLDAVIVLRFCYCMCYNIMSRVKQCHTRLTSAAAGLLAACCLAPANIADVACALLLTGLAVVTCYDMPQQSKWVMRAAARLAPAQVLNSTAIFQQAALATASTSNNNAAAAAAAAAPTAATGRGSSSVAQQQQLQQGHMALEAAVLLLEAVLPSFCDPVIMGREPSLKDGLRGLLQQLLGMRFSDPLLVTLVGAAAPLLLTACHAVINSLNWGHQQVRMELVSGLAGGPAVAAAAAAAM